MIQPIVRALELLNAMGHRRLSTIADLQRTTSLPKSTVHRLLATLIECGYVEKDVERSVYMLTAKISALGDGFGDDSRFVQASIPVAKQLTKQTQWPVAVGTPEGNSIVVQYSTRPYSRFCLRPSTVNLCFPLFNSALGQAYVGFCSKATLCNLVDSLRQDQSGNTPAVQCDRSIEQLVDQIRQRGYGLRIGQRGESTHIALPVMQADHVLGVIGMSLFSSCYDDTTSSEIVDKLRAAVLRIQASISTAGAIASVPDTGLAGLSKLI